MLGICTRNLLHGGSCTHFPVQNIEHARKNTIKRDVPLNNRSNMMMFFDSVITVCFKSQLRKKYNGCTTSLFCKPKKKLHEEKTCFLAFWKFRRCWVESLEWMDLKVFLLLEPKWTRGCKSLDRLRTSLLKHSLFMCNSTEFIYIVTAMCCKITLRGMYGRAAKSPCKYPANELCVTYLNLIAWIH